MLFSTKVPKTNSLVCFPNVENRVLQASVAYSMIKASTNARGTPEGSWTSGKFHIESQKVVKLKD